MTNTERKLSEAKFFYRQLKSVYPKLPQSDYYLSAFISSARSITWIMRAEYCRVPHWESWYVSKVPGQIERELLKQFNELRVRSEKKTPILSSRLLQILIPQYAQKPLLDYVVQNGQERHRIYLEKVTKNKRNKIVVSKRKIIVPVNLKKVLELTEFPKEDVLSIAYQYLKMIEKIVRECVRKFGVPNKSLKLVSPHGRSVILLRSKRRVERLKSIC